MPQMPGSEVDYSEQAFTNWLKNFVDINQRPPTAEDVWFHLHPILVSRTKKLNRIQQRFRAIKSAQ